MIYRKLDSNGDYVFGQGAGNFLQDSPETVAQAVATRLKLFKGEWFTDTTAGTPYSSSVLGAGKISSYDNAIQEVILQTPGVVRITKYSSAVNSIARAAEINCTIDTLYGKASVSSIL